MNKENKRSFKDILRALFLKDVFLKILALLSSVVLWLILGYLFV